MILNSQKFKRLLALIICGSAVSAWSQSSAFTYQGQLQSGGQPASGNFDLTFSLCAAQSGGSQLGATITNTGVSVTNGFFSVLLNFGAPPFSGNALWLQIGVRASGDTNFTLLSPLQEITSAPYAITSLTSAMALSASSVSSHNIVGPLSASQLPRNLITNGASGITLTGEFSGNAAGLSNLNAATLVGTIPAPSLPSNANESPLSWNVSLWGDSLTYGIGAYSYGYMLTNYIPSIVPFVNGYSGQSSSYILEQFLAAPSQRKNVQVFWMGRNDGLVAPGDANITIVNLNTAVRTLTFPSNKIVLGILTSTNDSAETISVITNLNNSLSNIYSPWYLDAHTMLEANGNGSETDYYYISQGWTPYSLLAPGDGLHLNINGYMLVASNVARLISAQIYTQAASVGALPSLVSNLVAGSAYTSIASYFPSLTVGEPMAAAPTRILRASGFENYVTGNDILDVMDTAPFGIGAGGAINLWGYYNNMPGAAIFARLKASKENSINGDTTGDAILYANNGGGPFPIAQFYGGTSNTVLAGNLTVQTNVAFANGVGVYTGPPPPCFPASNGSIYLATNGAFYVRSNGAWNPH